MAADVSSIEKRDDVAIEKLESPEDRFTDAELRSVVWKLDLFLMPVCFLLYTFSVLDRSNLGNAKLAGMTKDIDLSGDHYELLGDIFYLAYIVFQFNNLGWRIFKPHQWVTFAVLFWGTVSTLQSVCSNWAGLMACRFFLGWAETMFGPGIPLYFSYFYPREYIGLRFGIFLSGAALANAYGGALAYGLSHIHSNIPNWKFLFIIEGVPTVLLAAFCWFYFPDSPENARFLNERERRVAQNFANNQPGDYEHKGLQLKQLGEAFKDYRNWIFAVMNFSTNVIFASLPLFLPTIISEMGSFSKQQANGLSAPPYAFCFIIMIIVSFLSDRYQMRGPFSIVFSLLSAAGFLMFGVCTSVASRYAASFLAVLVFVSVSLNLVWLSNTNSTGTKKAGGLWIMMTVGQCGPLLGSNVFPSTDEPYYRKGMWISFAFALVAAVAEATQSFLMWRENRRRDRKYGKVETIGRKVNTALDPTEVEANMRYVI